MTDYVIQPAALPVVPVLGSAALFPVRRILCVGRNYAAHRREMGGDDRELPFFFAKPNDAIVPLGGAVPYPTATSDLHHEVELVVALKAGGAGVAPAQALDMVFGYAVGVDLTRRDLQSEAKKQGRPWDASKGFDASAPISAIREWRGAPPAKGIRLAVDGETRQTASLTDMIWSVPEIISEASNLWRLAPGDLIFTGTPEGVGPLQRGNHVHAEIDDVGELDFSLS